MARIAVFCSSSERIDPQYVRLAHAVGTEMARRGHDLVSGGGRVSMMGAIAEAVRAGGRHTIGVIPRALATLELADHAADELVVTAGMRERKQRMDVAADGFLALPGGLGTLEELVEVWVARALRMHAKPVVVLDPTGLFDPLHAVVDRLIAHGFVQPAAAAEVVWARTVGDALDCVERGLGPAAQALLPLRLDPDSLGDGLPGAGAPGNPRLK